MKGYDLVKNNHVVISFFFLDPVDMEGLEIWEPSAIRS